MMSDQEKIYDEILAALRNVTDPETGADVIRMRLVLDLTVDEEGTVNYIFRPSSPLCPIALPLVMEIIETVKSVEGVSAQKVKVVNYAGADELNKILASLPLSKQDRTK
jgi:metal-sulfur cluster biosynthetic enzyme